MAHPLTTGPATCGPTSPLHTPALPPRSTRPPTRRPWAFMALAGALALSMAACAPSAENAQESTAGPSSAASTPSPTATVDLPLTGAAHTEPPAPAELASHTNAGAIATVEYFLRLSLYGAATGNWDTYNALLVGDCPFCEAFRDTSLKAYDEGTRVEIPDIHVLTSTAFPWDDDPSKMRVDVLVDKDSYIRTKADGTESTMSVESAMIGAILSFDGQWFIEDLDVFEPDVYSQLHPNDE